ncbi:MAG: protein kinase [Labilithrix sp.]|nr:protein kinase [Labilithrix sp.]
MDPAQYQPGQVLPGTVYRVVRHLATGGMGSVYDVEDVTVEKRYVLKTLHPNLVAREDLALRMRDEAKSLARLQHPNIVDVVTAGVTNDAQKMPFYVMERLIGQNLRVVLEKTGVLHVPHAYRIAIDVADALEHAHENNIVHRDVKPENIFLHRNANGTTTTKLLDFGIVRLLDRKASHTHGKFIGTLRYASPEQVTGKKVGPATDIYSLAVVLFEMLAGRGPFDDAGDAYAVGSAHANTPAPPLSRFVRGVAPDVEQIVASALAKNPEERPRDCFAFASELRRILRDEEASPRSATAVNLLTSASPPTQARPVDSASIPGGPTVQGMIPPSAVMSGQPSVIASPPTTRPEGKADAEAPISPIAPTLAAAGHVSYSPHVQVNAAPLPAAGAPAAGRPIDRSAPTRESAPLGRTQRVAQNDTQMDPSANLASDDAVRAALGEPVALVVPGSVRTGPSPSDLVFPPMQSSIATGPIATEAPVRPPERGPFILVGVAAVLAISMVGGAFVAVRKPWHAAAKADGSGVATVLGAPVTEPAPGSASGIAGGAQAPPSAAPRGEPAAASAAAGEPSPAATTAIAAPASTTPSTRGRKGSAPPTPAPQPPAPQPTVSPAPRPPVAPPTAETKPRPAPPAPTKDIPFDP